jgi:hypothetical protein
MGPPKVFYFNDLRHWYVYCLEPPWTSADVVRPVQEVAGAVDAVVVQVDGGTGLWYPSKVGRRHLRNAPRDGNVDVTTVGAWKGDMGSIMWRAWQGLALLDSQGVDLLEEMVMHAHARGMELHTSLRMATIPDMDPASVADQPASRFPEYVPEDGKTLPNPPTAQASGRGQGLATPGMLEYQLSVLTEQLVEYNVDGVELDFAAPGGTAWFFPPTEGPSHAHLLTHFLTNVRAVARGRGGTAAVATVGVHVYPTEVMCTRHGLAVREWIAAGLVDWVMVSFYPAFFVDCDMPLEWLIDCTQGTAVSVVGRVNPWVRDGSSGGLEDSRDRVYADTPTMRAAAAAHLAKGCRGLYLHSMRWPLGEEETDFLCELRGGGEGAGSRLAMSDKRYVLPRRSPGAAALGYDHTLPFELVQADTSAVQAVPLYLADAPPPQGGSVALILSVAGGVVADTLVLTLNGCALDEASAPRTHEPRNGNRGIDRTSGSYDGLKTTVVLDSAVARGALRQGRNELGVCLAARPTGLGGGVTIAELELWVTTAHGPPRPRSAARL